MSVEYNCVNKTEEKSIASEQSLLRKMNIECEEEKKNYV